MYYLACFLSQYGKAFGIHATRVVLLVPGFNIPPYYNHRFKSLPISKMDHPLTYLTFLFIAVGLLLSFTE